MKPYAWTALSAVLTLAGAQGARAQPASPAKATGYLDGSLLSQALDLMPRPPARGSAQARADRAAFVRTRALKNTPRWRLAQMDVTDNPLDTFACALGVQLKTGDAPALDRLLQRLGADRGPLVDAGKFHYATRRPYLNSGAAICEPETAHLAGNPDYPSGHAASGWSIALVLAELAPGRSAPVLARGRAFAQSRVICGSHTQSAVDAATLLASELVAAEHGSPMFREDLDAARRDLQAPRLDRQPSEARCRLEALALRGDHVKGVKG